LLIGDVGEESSVERPRAQRRLPTRDSGAAFAKSRLDHFGGEPQIGFAAAASGDSGIPSPVSWIASGLPFGVPCTPEPLYLAPRATTRELTESLEQQTE
jgi:hypothetical protein